LDAWDGYILNLMEENKIRIIYTLDMEDFSSINHIKAINPVTEGKMRELHHFLREGNSS
jgi:predicted nucleic acid-binding protein